MRNELAAVIDSLYERKRKRRSFKSLVIVVGGGLWRISNILNDNQARKEGDKRGYKYKSKKFREFKWRLFEYARFFTANALPTFAHCCIHRLVLDGICRDLITTNYDLAFDSIWSKYPSLEISPNPVCEDNECLWEGYYNHRRRTISSRHYWKIHGSLSHVVFFTKSDRFKFQLAKLPRFAVATNYPEIAESYGLHTAAPYLGFEATNHSKTNFPEYSRLSPTCEPFIDWTYNNNRYLFKREIEAAKKVLLSTKQNAAILLLGFRGYYNPAHSRDPWNEELTPVIMQLLDSGYSQLYMAVHNEQFATIGEKESVLLRRMHGLNKCIGSNDLSQFLSEVLRTSDRFPIDKTNLEYRRWANHWYLTMREAPHV